MKTRSVLKKILILAVVLVAIGALTYFAAMRSMDLDYTTFAHNGMDREYLLYLPENLPDNAPLVFSLHGYAMQAQDMWYYTGMNAVADQHGFAVVYPQGTLDDGGTTHWNANLKLREKAVDDTAFLTYLARYLQKTHNLDPERTFSSGLSNGGFMSYHLALDAPETFHAMASVVGAMSGPDWERRDIAKPFPVLQISGVEDHTVPIDGTMDPKNGWGGAPHMDTVMAYWSEVNLCKDSRTVKIGEDTTAVYYENGVDGNAVWDYRIDGFGHNWPGGHAELYGFVVASAPATAIHASEVIWEFFSKY